MNAISQILRLHAKQLAEAVAEKSEEANNFDEGLIQLVEQVATALDEGKTLDPTPLYNEGLSEDDVASVLRLLLFEGFEVLRTNIELSEGWAGFNECALALRNCLHSAIPRKQTCAPDRAFFDALLDGRCETSSPAHQRLFHLFNALADVAHDMGYAHDLNGNFLYLNEPALTLLHFTKEDVKAGLNIFDILSPEIADLIESRLQAPSTVIRAPYAVEVYTKDGDRFPLELTTCYINDASIILGLGRDQRLARRVEAELHDSTDLAEKLMDNAPLGIVLADHQGVIADINPTGVEIFGAPNAAAILGGTFHQLFEGDPSCLLELIDSTVTSEERGYMRLTRTTVFGASINCDITIIPRRPKLHNAPGLLILLSDVSNQVALQASLVQSERLSAIGEIVAGVAHELNNPLTGILGYAQLLMAGKLDAPIRSRLENVMTEAERCRRIVQNLLSFARHYESEASMQQINDLLHSILSLREYQLRVDGINIDLNLAEDLPFVLADPHDIQRVFLNLINNAQQALAEISGREKTLTIKTFARDKSVHIVFADNGPGIPHHIQSKIFDPFFTTKGVGQGTGLGLSVSYGIVRSHGGRIQVESKEGHGAAFTILLPLPESNPQNEAPDEPPVA